MSESDASEMSEMSETHDLPKKDVDEVWRTKTSGIYHTRRCAAIKNADTVLTRNREALTRHCDECGLCADDSTEESNRNHQEGDLARGDE